MASGCPHHDDGSCPSCPLLSLPYPQQLAVKADQALARLTAVASDFVWLPPIPSPQFGIRNVTKMVVSGTVDSPVLGLPPSFSDTPALGIGIDLTDCPLYLPTITAAFPALKQFITTAQLVPYDLTPAKGRTKPKAAATRGELKNVIITASPDCELMIQFVLRSRADEARIRSRLPSLLAALPNLKVVSLNIHPEHKAVVSGLQDIILTDQQSLPFRIADFTLYVGPGCFFQTNTLMATALYQLARKWLAGGELTDGNLAGGDLAGGDLAENKAGSHQEIWDLFCGIGGFSLALANPHRQVIGVEISAASIANALLAKAHYKQGLSESSTAPTTLDFIATDAYQFAESRNPPEVIVVNPPRRGLGISLANWLDNSKVPTILYSSCNPETLSTDLRNMPNYQLVQAQALDMFPGSTHLEVLTLLTRL